MDFAIVMSASTTSVDATTNMMTLHDDVMPLRIVFLVTFFVYILSLVTLGRISITHQWLFSNLTAIQPTVESIACITQSLSSSAATTGNNNTSQQVHTSNHHQSFRNVHNANNHRHNNNTNRNRTTPQQQQRRRTVEVGSSSSSIKQESNEVLADQLSILEFSTMKIQPGVIALQQYRRLRDNGNTTTNNNNQRVVRTSNDTTTSTTNDPTNEAFILWKYLETAVLSCIALFAILILRWLSHVRNCRYLAYILQSTLETLQDTRQRGQNLLQQQYRRVLFQEWTAVSTTVESNSARWWLMLFIVLTSFTWFHLVIMARKKATIYPGVRSYYSPFSWFCGIAISYYVWRHIRTNQGDQDYDGTTDSSSSLYSWHIVDDALDELSSRILLLARLFGWKMDGQILWDIIRRSVRILVTIFCGAYGYIIADPIWTLQEAMVYRLYVGSGNDIQYNQKGIRNSSSRWRNIQSKRVFVMETLWKLVVLIALIGPIVNLTYTNMYGLDHGFAAAGSRRLVLQISYVILLCILVRKFQQDYLMSALPAAVILLQQFNHSFASSSRASSTNESSPRNRPQLSNATNRPRGNNRNNNNNNRINQQQRNNNSNNDDADLENEDDLHFLLRYPFAIRIESILQNGTKLVCIPLLLTVLFGINHISDFQRGQSTFPSAYGGPWRSHRSAQKWHQNRTLSQLSTFLEPSLMTIPTKSSGSKQQELSAVELLAILSNNNTSPVCDTSSYRHFKTNHFVERLLRIPKGTSWTSIIGAGPGDVTCREATHVPSVDLKAIAFQPLNKTLPSALRKLQKLAKASLKDNNIRASFTGYRPKSRSSSSNPTEHKEQELLFQVAQKNVNETTSELWEVVDAIFHHPLITSETVYTLSRFLELILCLVWTILVLPFLVMTSHQSMVNQRWAFLQLNASALHANPQDADD